jgi:hypothetical protein
MRHLILSIILLIGFGIVANSQSIYKTPSGKKYHLASCHNVRNVSEKITIERARELGLEPCMQCRPPAIPLGGSTDNKAQGTSNVSVQCSGTTKQGLRCKNKTRIGNGYCYHHQP